MPFPTTGKLLLDSYAEKPESALLRTEMETGPAKQSKIKSRVMVVLPVSYVFTYAEYQAFKSFFENEINMGSAWWSWLDPFDGQTKQVRIKNGVYVAKPKNTNPGATLDWSVDFELEKWGSS